MKRFIVFPGLINEQYQHDTLEAARASARAVAVTSEDAIVCEVHYTFERSTDVAETMQLALPSASVDFAFGRCRNGNLTVNGVCQAQTGECDCVTATPPAEAQAGAMPQADGAAAGQFTEHVEAPCGNIDPRQGYANP